MLLVLLFWLVPCAAYVALVWGLAWVLPATAYPWLRGLHWGTLGLCLLAALAPALTLGDWTFQSLELLCALLLASGVLAGIRGRLRTARSPALATTQAGLTGVAAPFLLGFSLGLDGPSSDVAYADGTYRVTVTEHYSLLRYDQNYPEAKLYRKRLGLFEEYMGFIGHEGYAPSATVPEATAWWHNVSALTFADDSIRGMARYNGTDVRVWVNPPYRRGREAPRPVEPVISPAAPMEDTTVYTYVEEMPRLPDTNGSRASIIWAIEKQQLGPRTKLAGTLFMSFEVTKTGNLRAFRIVRGLNSAADSAILAAARQLPRFIPGRQDGKPMNVSFTLPIQVAESAKKGIRSIKH